MYCTWNFWKNERISEIIDLVVLIKNNLGNEYIKLKKKTNCTKMFIIKFVILIKEF